ncbi:MAG TPA: hypothetical protein VGX70_00170 [Gemmataceae bacterium]|jgi:hypothetical protein|nr:hypothetical protein [Gemmataceae bacterium]
MYTDEHFFQVFGHISVFFATWDFIVTQGLVRLMTIEARRNKKNKFGDRTTLQRKLEIIKDLLPKEVIDKTVLEQLQALLPEALVAGEKRNRFTHDQWEFNDENIQIGKIRRLTLKWLENGLVSPEYAETTFNELKQYLDQIGSLQIRFSSIMKQLPTFQELLRDDPARFAPGR